MQKINTTVVPLPLQNSNLAAIVDQGFQEDSCTTTFNKDGYMESNGNEN